jgi:hypothetical protein
VPEHAIVGGQQLRHQQLEELLLYTPSINALLANEVHPQGFEQITLQLPADLREGVLHQMVSANPQNAHITMATWHVAIDGKGKLQEIEKAILSKSIHIRSIH